MSIRVKQEHEVYAGNDNVNVNIDTTMMSVVSPDHNNDNDDDDDGSTATPVHVHIDTSMPPPPPKDMTRKKKKNRKRKNKKKNKKRKAVAIKSESEQDVNVHSNVHSNLQANVQPPSSSSPSQSSSLRNPTHDRYDDRRPHQRIKLSDSSTNYNHNSPRIGFTLDYEPRSVNSDRGYNRDDNRGYASRHDRGYDRDLDRYRPSLSSSSHSHSRQYTYRRDDRQQPHDSHASSSASTSYHSPSSQRTSAITLLDTNHGRYRRQQRNIPRRDIQVAIKYGRKLPHPSNNPNLCIYLHNGKKHVVSVEESRRLITTMVQTINLKEKYVSREDFRIHDHHMDIIHNRPTRTWTRAQDSNDDDTNADATDTTREASNKTQKTSTSSWKSHSIIIVDKSGSMRESDVNGCRTRLGAVWLSLAQDFIEYRLNTGAASQMDVISIILMGEKAELIVDRHPTNMILYNRIVQYFWDSERADEAFCRGERPMWGLIRPSGHGCYGPSLKKAEELLDLYDDGNSECALQILLLSDGRPSDGYVLFNKTNRMFGRKRDRDRAAGGSIDDGDGDGDDVESSPGKKEARERAEKEDAHKTASKTLQESVEQIASKYGRRFNFAAIGMGHQKEYDCLKRLVVSAKDYGSEANFQVPGLSCAEIGAAVSSAATSLTACQTILRTSNAIGGQGGGGGGPKRIRKCMRESMKNLPLLTEMVDDSFDIFMDGEVERLEFKISDDAEDDNSKKTFNPVPLKDPEARGVAMKKCAFGEGQERLAFQFFEIAEDGCTVVGEPLVAKESRFIDDDYDDDDENNNDHDAFGRSNAWKNRDQFAKRFCKIQTKAKLVAEAFNAKLDSIPALDDKTPRVSFIDCCVYYLTQKSSGNQCAVIVEPKLGGRFEKWNNNNGWKRKSVGGNLSRRQPMAPVIEDEQGEEKKSESTRTRTLTAKDQDDGIIDLTNDDDDDKDTISVTKNQVAQAFSHFSYIHSGKKMLICDLQGQFCKLTNKFCFTDPAIHYHNARRDECNKKTRYGRTDMGQKGIDNFFQSHKCNALCDLVTGGFINAA